MEKTIDCVLCGSCVVDILVHPVPLDVAIGGGGLVQVDPIQVTTGGIVSNSGIAMARLGMNVAAFSYVGNDEWASVIRRNYEAEGIDTSYLLTHRTEATSTTAVLIDPSGERSFAHCVGAPRTMDGKMYRENLDVFRRARMTVIGYYSLMPNLEKDLAAVLAEIRGFGCLTALDAAGDGGTMEPLSEILPHLDVYIPSLAEATHQTGESDPQKIIDIYRQCGAPGLLGVKLGSEGALLSPKAGEYIPIECVPLPGPIVDTTGAGDSFYAGVLTGLLKGMNAADAGRLGAAAGACCVTGMGASAGLRNFEETAKLANLNGEKG
ncbi:MAG: carbohydrate kinase family protein [Planctomycetes bacterium]|nr:carbohydrate kinase family protein [Planctomycetota bacterium]MBL7039604.1 carbohydrate kinase family protein [Pirellulaceae bacterium]